MITHGKDEMMVETSSWRYFTNLPRLFHWENQTSQTKHLSFSWCVEGLMSFCSFLIPEACLPTEYHKNVSTHLLELKAEKGVKEQIEQILWTNNEHILLIAWN
jgi:hypothetical protein